MHQLLFIYDISIIYMQSKEKLVYSLYGHDPIMLGTITLIENFTQQQLCIFIIFSKNTSIYLLHKGQMLDKVVLGRG